MAADCKEIRRQPHDPVDREQKSDPHDHGQQQSNPASFRPQFRRQLARKNRDEHDVVDPQHDFKRMSVTRANPFSQVKSSSIV